PALAVLDPETAGVTRLHQHLAAAELIALDGLLAGALTMTARYIGERSQFGRRLAEFQAVAQQIADVYVTSRLTALAIEEVVRRLSAGEPAQDDLAIATLWCTDRIVAELQTCHHLHGGVGVDETYPLGAYTSAALDATRRLGGRLAAIKAAPITAGEGAGAELTAEQRAFKADVRAYFSGLMTHADQEELLVDRHGPAYHRIIKQMGADGYLGVGWPVAYGGKGLDGIHQAIFANEAARADVHLPAVTLQTVGPTLQEFGTEKQKEMFLPRILTGDVHFAIGYSEPDAGTDLASLRTTARKDANGDWIVNGQKLWTTGGHVADYLWLAARTDPAAPKHAGISILIVDTRDPGFSWTPIRTIDGSHHVNATYFNDVRVPADMLVGEENGGWRLITTQLNHERVMLGPAGRLEGLRDQVLEWAATRGLLADPGVREVLASTTASFRVNELLNWQVAGRPATGRATVADASACKIFASTEVQRLGRELLGIVSTYGDPADPETAWLLRLLDATVKRNLVLTFGGGVNEVQRELVAQFGLGLPRVPR
ncbi:MAG: acyl-CoA dehydrogenase family protein, partial [Nocardioides sp.]